MGDRLPTLVGCLVTLIVLNARERQHSFQPCPILMTMHLCNSPVPAKLLLSTLARFPLCAVSLLYELVFNGFERFLTEPETVGGRGELFGRLPLQCGQLQRAGRAREGSSSSSSSSSLAAGPCANHARASSKH